MIQGKRQRAAQVGRLASTCGILPSSVCSLSASWRNSGSEAKISGDKAQKLKSQHNAGPTEADDVCTHRDNNLQRIARQGMVGETLVTATTLLASVDRSGRPAALPDWLAGE